MKPKERSCWVKPPSPEETLSWKAFLAVGHRLKAMMRCQGGPDLFSDGDLDKLLVEMNLKEPEPEPEPEKAKGEPAEVEVVANESAGPLEKKFRKALDLRRRFMGGGEPERGASTAAILKNEDAFPFLKGLGMPLSAKVITAMLASIYAETYSQVSMEDIPRIFRLMELPLEEHAAEGARLVAYAKRSDALIDMARDRESLKLVAWLNKAGYKALLGIELKNICPEDFDDSLPRRARNPFKFGGNRGMKGGRGDGSDKPEIPKITLDDVVLDKEARFKLDYVVKHHMMNRKEPFRLLFCGPPGTGKTYTALALAGELRKPMITMDLSKVLDMFVGETEKILTEYFDRAERQRAMIFMDEADSFFKERSPGNKTWENNHVNHVLKLIEKRKVCVVLCTNLYEALDDALLRRVDEIIEYKLPTGEERAGIWKKELKKNFLPVEGVDIEALSSLEMTGGLIANAARKANKIRVVEGDGFIVDTKFLQGVAEDELKKMGRSFAAKKICGFGG